MNRITLFKIPKVEDQEKLLGIYREMPSNAGKVREGTSAKGGVGGGC